MNRQTEPTDKSTRCNLHKVTSS